MKKTRFKKPYRNDGKTNFRESSKQSGVYIIADKKSKELLYVGYSTYDLYKTMYRHFQAWPRSKSNWQYRAVFDREKCLVRIVYLSPGRSIKLERALILKHQPPYNKEKYENHILTVSEKNQVAEYENSPCIKDEDIPF